MGREAFKLLAQAGLKYDRRSRLFYLDEDTDVDAVNRTLTSLRGIRLLVVKACVICGGEVDCDSCDFKSVCEKKQPLCVCDNCLSSDDVFSSYKEAQSKDLLPELGKF